MKTANAYDWILIYTEIVEESGKFKFTMSLHVEMVIFAINQSEMTEIVYQKVCFSISTTKKCNATK